jgi:hypothetical protein
MIGQNHVSELRPFCGCFFYFIMLARGTRGSRKGLRTETTSTISDGWYTFDELFKSHRHAHATFCQPALWTFSRSKATEDPDKNRTPGSVGGQVPSSFQPSVQRKISPLLSWRRYHQIDPIMNQIVTDIYPAGCGLCV